MSNRDEPVTLDASDIEAIAEACKKDPINIICVGVLTGFFDMKDVIALAGLRAEEAFKSTTPELAPAKVYQAPTPTVQHNSLYQFGAVGSGYKRKFVGADYYWRASSEITPEPPAKRPRVGQKIYCRWGSSQHVPPCGFSFAVGMGDTAYAEHLEDVHRMYFPESKMRLDGYSRDKRYLPVGKCKCAWEGCSLNKELVDVQNMWHHIREGGHEHVLQYTQE